MRDALRMELQTFSELASRPDTMDLVEAARAAYEDGGDSYDAFGLPRDGLKRSG